MEINDQTREREREERKKEFGKRETTYRINQVYRIDNLEKKK